MKKTKKKSLSKGFQKIPLSDLIQAEWNYKKFNDPVLHKKLVANIKKNGQIENLITHENEEGLLVITNGNHRYLAMVELGMEAADCYHLGKLTDAQAKRIAVETNETKFDTDKNKLASILEDIMEIGEEDFKETNPFSDKETDALLSLLKEDEEDLLEEIPSDKPKKSKTVLSQGGVSYTTLKLELTPRLADRFNDAMARFNTLSGNSEGPLDIMIQLVEYYTNEEILEIIGKPLKSKKAKLKLK
jgi:hypothetical protein